MRWEKAEKEVVTLKQQLEAAARKNSALEERVVHLDGALKECVRQLWQSREDQDQKMNDALIKKTREWESSKLEFENQLSELQTQLQAAKAEAAAFAEKELELKLEVVQKENSMLKLKLHTQAKELKVKALEGELSTQTAETASKQHLESIKKVAKLEAECRRLRAAVRKASSVNGHKHIGASPYAESLTDSRSDSGERSLLFETDAHKKHSVESREFKHSSLDSWSSALIVGLDLFKNEKPIGNNIVSASIDVNIMDDFLEMERLAAMPDAENIGCCIEPGAGSHKTDNQNGQLKAELESALKRIVELEGKVQILDDEKVRLEMASSESQNQLGISHHHLLEAKDELEELQKQLQLANDYKLAKELEAEAANSKRKAVELQLKQMDAEVLTLHTKVGSLEGQIGEEQALAAVVAAKCQTLEGELKELQEQLQLANECKQAKELEAEAANSKRKEVELQLKEKDAEVQTLETKVSSLEGQIGEVRALSADVSAKCQTLEDELSKRKQEVDQRRAIGTTSFSKIKQEELVAAQKLAECQKTIASLGRQLNSLATLDDFLLDPEVAELNGGSSISGGGELSGSYFPKISKESVKIVNSSFHPNGMNEKPLPPSNPPSLENPAPEKMRNGIGKLFSRSKKGSAWA
ncbi:hypothetical protein ACLOJK_033168 [Asimina triloba]